MLVVLYNAIKHRISIKINVTAEARQRSVQRTGAEITARAGHKVRPRKVRRGPRL